MGERGIGQGRRVRWGGHGRCGPCRFRPAPTTVGRSCQALPSPRPALPPPPSSPRRRGSRLASTGMDGRPEVWTVMSAIDGGPGYAAFFVGGRTWIPACWTKPCIMKAGPGGGHPPGPAIGRPRSPQCRPRAKGWPRSPFHKPAQLHGPRARQQAWEREKSCHRIARLSASTCRKTGWMSTSFQVTGVAADRTLLKGAAR